MPMSQYSKRVRPTAADAALLSADSGDKVNVEVERNIAEYIALKVGPDELANCITSMLRDHLLHLSNLKTIYSGMDEAERIERCRTTANSRWKKWREDREKMSAAQIEANRAMRITVSDKAHLAYMMLSHNKRERTRKCAEILVGAHQSVDRTKAQAFAAQSGGGYENCITIPKYAAEAATGLARKIGVDRCRLVSYILETA